MHWAERYAKHPEGAQSLLRDDAKRNRLYIGVNNAGEVYTDLDTHALVLAPARSRIGKTASFGIPNTIAYRGPVVASSNKRDLATQTALMRSIQGDIWHWAIDGEKLIPGAQMLRFSFILW